jgi:hypothetical protein
MYDTNDVKTTRECELTKIHSEFLELNEITNSTINDIRASLGKIKPFPERENPSKPGLVSGEKENSSFVSSVYIQLSFARRNADNLKDILKHLDSLI